MVVLTLLVSCRRSDRPENVVLITVDTTRADRLGPYGSTSTSTPAIDRLAAEGVVFERAIASASVTPVSLASIHTGQYPFEHGLRKIEGELGRTLSEDAETLAEILQGSGYSTGAFVSAYPASASFGLGQGFDAFDPSYDDEHSTTQTLNTGHSQRSAAETAARALEWLALQDQPFFLWLHFFDPHDPAFMPRPVAEHPELPGLDEDERRYRFIYDREVEFVDEVLGKVIEWLERSRQLENSLTVVVADHGEGLGDHDWWGHGILYEEQIKVPLIIRFPNADHGGSRISRVVRTIDIFPTVLGFLGLEPSAETPYSRSLLPVVSAPAADPPRPAYSDGLDLLSFGSAPARPPDVKDDILHSWTHWPWKLIHHRLRPDESELYELEADPEELRNLYLDRPEIAARMLEELLELDLDRRSAVDSGQPTREDVERLRSLGYVN